MTAPGSTTSATANESPPEAAADHHAPVVGSLSPSRAADFKNCPLLYRFRTIDRLPEVPSPTAVRGTLVHNALDRLFDLDRAQRTPEAARELIQPEWEQLLAEDPELQAMFGPEPDPPPDGAEPAAATGADSDRPGGEDSAAAAGGEPAVAADAIAEGPVTPDTRVSLRHWLESARELVTAYFELEDPTRFEPADREQLVEAMLDGGVLLRGYVDRLDIAPTGEVRVVDYKTGAMPREMFEAKALFQMKFYALVLWRGRGVLPTQLKLIYLAHRDALTYSPDEAELLSLERQLHALWRAIQRALDSGDFRPNPGRICDWCSHKALCPAFGGTPPPFPQDRAVAAPGDRRAELSATDRRADQD